MLSKKLFSEACEKNKQPILNVIKPLLQSSVILLEIGSGTGQHAVYFAEEMPHLKWQTSDVKENHPSINSWLDDSQLDNILPPVSLNVLTDPWPDIRFDAVYSANTAHIMSWQAVEAMFSGVAKKLNPDGVFILYGPFNYQGNFTSDSNQQFDLWLKSVDAERGIRNFEALQKLAEKYQMSLLDDYAMPANNRILVWRLNS